MTWRGPRCSKASTSSPTRLRYHGPHRPQRDHRQVVRRADRHQRRRDRKQRRSSWKTPSRTWAPSWCNEVADQNFDIAGDGTTTATVLARSDPSRRHPQHRGRQQPDGHSPRHRTSRRAATANTSTAWPKTVSKKDGNRPSRRDQCQQRPCDRRPAGRRHGNGRQRRRDHRRGRQIDRNHARIRRRHAVRQGLLSPYFINQSWRDGSRVGRRLHADPREEDQQLARADTDPGADRSRANRC